MPATATPRENTGDYRPTLTREDGVLRGTRYYAVVGASSLADALLADGLPATGDPYDAGMAQLLASRFEPMLEPGAHGFYRVRVDYREDNPQDGSITPGEGVAVTTLIEQSRVTENVDYDVTLTVKLTHDGSGVPKLLNAMTVRVTTYSASVPDLAALVALSDPPTVNDAAVALPRLLGSNQTLNADAGQLLYAGFRLFRQGEFFGTEHELMLRRNWLVPKWPRDAEGNPVGGATLYPIYEEADFSAVIG